MLLEWVRAYLLPKQPKSAKPADPPPAVQVETVQVGSVLRAGAPADRFLLSDQFLHKSLLLVLHELPGGLLVTTVLNRPTVRMQRM